MRRTFVLSLVLLAGLLGRADVVAALPASPILRQSEPDSTSRADLDAFIASVMEEWKVPGLAIAVVRDGEVILSKGYGLRDVDEQLPVTPRTLFAIGSVTKSFTVTVLGMLQDDGLLDWDEPVRWYLPDFKVYDEVVSERMTPRDLVTHRSGLPRHDLMWYGSAMSRRELYDRLQYLEPSRDFRAAFQYQNLMYMTAGYLAGQLSGQSWEELVEERVFRPLGMTRSNFSVTESQMGDDFAYPYTVVGEDVRQIDFRNLDEIGPAGSINSNVDEMARYVQFHIDEGRYGEERLLSEANAVAMQTPQMAMQDPIPDDELGHTSYGMGFFVTTYQGHKLVHHGGGIDGFIALLSFMPRKRIGIVVLTNSSGRNPVPTIVSRGVYDRLLGLEPVDWLGRIKERYAEVDATEAEGGEEDSRVEGTSPSHALADYAGRYEHPAYGVIEVELAGDALQMTFNHMTSPLEHVHYDVFEVPDDPIDPFEALTVMFQYDKRGRIDRLLVPFESSVDDIVFRRVVESGE